MAWSPRPSRRWLHALLFASTFVTATISGSWFWEGHLDGAEGWRGLVGWDVLRAGTVYSVWVLLILGAHEMGHYLACRWYGIPATLPFFLPGVPPFGTFGAVIRMRGPIPDRRALFDVAAAGPIAGFAVAVPAIVIGLVRGVPADLTPQPGEILLGSPILSSILGRAIHGDVPLRVGSSYGAGWVGMLVTSMNLFPVGQLDGGHAAFALSRRLHRVLSWTTIAGLGTLVLVQAAVFRAVPAYTLWLVVLVLLRDRHPPVLDDAPRLGAGRLTVALLLLAMFVVSFIPLPIALAHGS